jgi:hypothetical protein
MKYTRTYLILIFLCFIPFLGNSQELNCNVEINTTQIQGSDKSIFTKLQSAVFEFVNNRKWTNNVFENNERIECTMLINITEQVAIGNYKATIQIQSRRPAFNSSYNATILNHIDKDFDFIFNEFDPLTYSETTYINNLTSVISYYVYIILALDYDSFSLEGGTPYFEKALAIVNNAQASSNLGWKAFENDNNRYWLVNDFLRQNYLAYRKGMYQYHRLGFDVMAKDVAQGRVEVLNSLKEMEKVYDIKPNIFILQMFFNAKKDEIVNLFMQATTEEKNEATRILNKINPANSNDYKKIIKGK